MMNDEEIIAGGKTKLVVVHLYATLNLAKILLFNFV